MPKQEIVFASLLFFMFLMGMCAGAVVNAAMNPPPRLLAIGCEGTIPTSILYANEEDHFPRCLAIVPND